MFIIIHPSHTCISFFFFNDTATTEIYTLSLHDALPICCEARPTGAAVEFIQAAEMSLRTFDKSGGSGRRTGNVSCENTNRSEEPRLNSSHSQISYAVFCLKKKKTSN